MQNVFNMDITGSPAIIETVPLAAIDLDLLAILDGIPELTSWLSAADAVIATPGTASSFQWRDRKNGIVGVPTQATIPPTLAVLNGQAAVKGAGAGIAYAGRTLLGASAYTRIVVAQPDAATTGAQALCGSMSGAGPRLAAYHNPDGQVITDNNPASATIGAVTTGGGVMTRGQLSMVVISWSAVLGQVRVRKAGATIATLGDVEVPGDPGASTIIGGANGATTDAFKGYLLEVLEFAGTDMLATSAGLESLGLIEALFQSKYGVA